MHEWSTGTRRVSALLRMVGYGLLVTAAVRSLAASWHLAACIGGAAALAALLERRIARRETPAAFAAEDHRRAAAARISLELSYDRTQSVLESLREGVVVVDGGGEVVMANPAARRALAKPHQDPMGRLLWPIMAGDIGRYARDAWQALREGDAVHDDATSSPQIRHSSIACDESFFDLTAVPVTSSESGHDYGTVFLIVDTTHNYELQQLKDSFLSSVSHELRTPLTNICAYSEILGSLLPGESAEWPEFVRVIHEESVQLSGLVDGMFDFLQLECGEAVFRLKALDASALLHGVVEDFVARSRESGVRLDVIEGEGGATVEVDHMRLEQVCRHLIENALKFTPPGGHVRVSFGQDGTGFELRVEDSGPGVPVDHRSAVFDKFTQLRDPLTDKPAGSGLGLATCRAIIGRLGGVIWCEDTELGGASFVVRLPLAGQPQLAGSGAMAGF